MNYHLIKKNLRIECIQKNNNKNCGLKESAPPLTYVYEENRNYNKNAMEYYFFFILVTQRSFNEVGRCLSIDLILT